MSSQKVNESSAREGQQLKARRTALPKLHSPSSSDGKSPKAKPEKLAIRDDDIVANIAEPLFAFSDELSTTAKRRLECIDSWRRNNEEQFSCGPFQRRQDLQNITDKMAPVYERLMEPTSAVDTDLQDEAAFIIRNFNEAPCTDFRPKSKHMTQTSAELSKLVCSICGLTREFHALGDDLDSSMSQSRDPTGNEQHQEPIIRAEVAHTCKSRPLSLGMQRLPSMTFGSVAIPHRFLGRIRQESLGGSYKRLLISKYLRFATDDCAEKMPFVWELLTRVWNLNPPTVVVSVTGGSVKSMDDYVKQSLSEALNTIVSRTNVWVLSGGRNYGASKFLGKILTDGNEEEATEDSELSGGQGRRIRRCFPVMIGVGHWGSLKRKGLLMSVSSPDMRSSKYFFSVEKRLIRDDCPSVLNPYQAAYLLLDNGKRDPGNCVENFRAELDKFLANKTISEEPGRSTFAERNSSPRLPVLTLVLGGDGERTLDQVIEALNSKYPVLIIKGSSSVTTLLSELFYALEDKLPRAGIRTNETLSWQERENKVFENYFRILDSKIQAVFNMNASDNENSGEYDDMSRVREKVKEIMTNRYYITVIDCELESGPQLCHSILREMFKGYDKLSGLTIALKARKSEFLEALFDITDDPMHQDPGKSFITVSVLNDLHRENFNRSSIMSKVLKMMCKRDSYNKAGDNFLPIVGRIIHLLLGPRYKLMYHERHFTDIDDEGSMEVSRLEFSRKKWQVWHLYIWSILSAKPGMTQFFIAQSTAPLGKALIAYHLYSGLAKWAAEGYEEELRLSLEEYANHFEQLAVSLFNVMYDADPEGAYRVLITELPFDLGPYITPLVIADDSKAMNFISQAGCQTYLQRVWKGNMAVETQNWHSYPIFFFLPFLAIPWIHFYDSSLMERKKLPQPSALATVMVKRGIGRLPSGSNSPKSPSDDSDSESSTAALKNASNKPSVSFQSPIGRRRKRHPSGNAQYGNLWNHIVFFYTAPITKFYIAMLSYICFLALLSYFVMIELKPFTQLSDISGVEWMLVVWTISLVAEECIQIFGGNETGPLHRLSAEEQRKLKRPIWHRSEWWKMRLYTFTLYLRNGRWNAVDVIIMLLFIVSYTLRFTLTLPLFQFDRFSFALTVIFCYFRLLRFWFVLPSIGPRIIAMQMMLTELMKFLCVLVVFISGFGVAFQAILNPNHDFSYMTVVDVFWRTFWQMFGELFLEDTESMGRDVSEMACRSQDKLHNETSFYCLSWAAPVLLSVYLLIANVLLINLLIATFSQAYEDVSSRAHTFFLFNLYSLIQECYYWTALPPPLNLFERLVIALTRVAKMCRKQPVNVIVEDSFRLKASMSVIRLQKKAGESIKSYDPDK